MPTKLLYCGNYLDGTGWGNASLMNILALDAAGVRVVPRAITFNGYAAKDRVHPRIKQLEEDDLSNIDVCIQHTLPPLYVYDSNFKNIGLYETETNDLQYSQWPKYINILDEAWVPNRQARLASEFSGVKIPVKIAHHSIDYDRYQKIEKTMTVDGLENSFNFCFVGEMVTRKDLTSLLIAFHTEFHPSENVNLFLKLSAPGLNSEQTVTEFYKLDDKVTAGLKIRSKYKKPYVVAGMLDERSLYSIMKQCHCFVTTSHGEAWCIPALEAMAMGMQVIYPDGSGMADFAMGTPVACHTSPCYGAVDSLPEVYSAFDTWQNVNIISLQSAMRSMYMKYQFGPDIWGYDPKAKAAEFDYKVVGQKLKGLIEC